MQKIIMVTFETDDEAHAQALTQIIHDVAPYMVDNVRVSLTNNG